MSEPLKPLTERLRRVDVPGPEADRLYRRLLTELAGPAGAAQVEAARALYGAADLSLETVKRRLYEQMVLCLTRALEDFAMLALVSWDESRHPLEAYLNLDRPELRNFFARARKGFEQGVVWRLMGVAPWDYLKKLPAFRGSDYSSEESALEWATDDANDILVRLGSLYHVHEAEADPVVGPWQVAYAKAPIGTKLLDSEESSELLLGADSADPSRSGSAGSLYFAEVRLDAAFGEAVIHHIEDVCRQIRRVAARKLVALDDPKGIVPIAYAEWVQDLGRRRAERKARGDSPLAPAAADASRAATPAKPEEKESPKPEEKAPEPRKEKPKEAAEKPSPKSDPGQSSLSEDLEYKEVGSLKIVHTKGMK